MRHTLTTIMGCAVAVLGVMATLASADVMTCTRDQETILSSPTGGQPVRKDCIMVKAANGQEVAVMVPNAKRGDRLDCAMIEGKLACK